MRLNYETNLGLIGHLMALVCIISSVVYFRIPLTAAFYYVPLYPFAPICLGIAGVPQVHHFGQEGLHNVLVIDLLGPNLEDLFDMCGRKFTIKTVCMAAKQMVSIVYIAWNVSCGCWSARALRPFGTADDSGPIKL